MARSVSVLTVSCGIFVLTSSGMANASDDTTTANGSASNQLEEIVVTAEKRSENISRVGLGITAFSGPTLQRQGIKDVADLAAVVPGLSYSLSRADTPIYTLRGVGFNDSSLGAYSPVAVYVDEVPLPFPALTTAAGLDLERVEVLKGPQGTLFGQNTTGGAINYIAAKPTDRFEAGTNIGYGRFNDVNLDGFISGPLADTVKGRFAFSAERADDWQHSYTRDDSAGKVRKFAARLLLDWQPSDRLQIELNLNGWENKSDPQMAQVVAITPQVPTPVVPALNAYPLSPKNDQAADWSPDIKPRGDESLAQSSLRGNYQLTDDLMLTSISSFVRYRRDNAEDTDGISLNDSDLGFDRGQMDSFDQEIRAANSGSHGFRWMVGGNYEHSTVDQQGLFVTGDSPVSRGLNFKSNGFFSNQKMNNYAGFANVHYDITSKLTAKVGGRFTQADRNNVTCTLDSGDGLIAGLFTFLSRELTGNPMLPAIPPGGCITLDSTTFLPTVYRKSLNEHNESWLVGLDYRSTPDFLFYVNVAKGYKAGSFGTISASTSLQFTPVTQESVMDYEGGFKAKFLDRRLELEGAAFHYDYNNKQVRGNLIDPIFGALPTLLNIPKSSVDGAELSLAWTPLRGLTLTGATTYLRAIVDSYTGVNNDGMIQNFAGSAMPFTPTWQYSTTADYTWPITNEYAAFVGATESYKGHAAGEIGSGPIEDIGSYGLLDFRAGLASKDNAWRFMFYGKNVTNKYYWTYTVRAYDTDVRYAGKPVTYGATVSYRFQ
jgi:iron complex outermembrane receptor protein